MGFFNQCPKCKASFVGRVCLACAGAPAPGSPDVATLNPGDSFHGLEILEVLQAGGMGVLYRAQDPNADREVALKLIRPDKSMEADLEKRFEREAETLSLLKHPNIVALYDSGKEGEDLFFTMEFVEGRDLDALLKEGPPNLKETLRIVSEICDALECAHEKGIVHRDIKPENILLDAEGHVKLADFGLAKLQGESKETLMLTMSGAVLGTQSYMAPEQSMDAAGVDHRADIYSVGIVLYQMLVGKLPRGKIEPPSTKGAGNSQFDALVLKATELDRGDRYQAISDLAGELRKISVEFNIATLKEDSDPEKAEPTTDSYIPPPEEVQPYLDDPERVHPGREHRIRRDGIGLEGMGYQVGAMGRGENPYSRR